MDLKGYTWISLILIFILIIGTAVQASQNVPVFSFQEDGEPTIKSHMIYKEPIVLDMTSLTVCVRIMLYYSRGPQLIEAYYLTMATKDNPNFIQINFNYMNGRIYFTFEISDPLATIERLLPGFLTLEWNYFCFTVNREQNQIKGYWNGLQIGEARKWGNATNLSPESYLLLGQEQDSFLSGFEKLQSFSGGITQIGVWNKVVPPVALRAASKCGPQPRDNLVHWEDLSRWNISSKVGVLEASEESFCEEDLMRNKLLLAHAQSGKIFYPLCEYVGGTLPISGPDDSPESHFQLVKWLLEKSKSSAFSRKTMSILAGARRAQNGTWLDGSGQRLQQPISNKRNTNEYNCSTIYGGILQVLSCKHVYSIGLCYLPEHKFYLKGISERETSVFDTEYFVYGIKNDMPVFRGLMNSHIELSGFARWSLFSHIASGFRRDFQSVPDVPIPLGRKTWTFPLGDTTMASQTLTFSICGKDEFTCDNGECIALSLKCDTIFHCEDRSDEKGCSFVIVDEESYSQELVPRKYEHTPALVRLSFEIIDIPVIDTFGQKILVDFMLIMEWKDYRLSFKNLHEEKEINTLNDDIKNAIWVPKLFFLNALKSAYTVIDVSNSFVVKRHNNPVQSGPSEASEAYIYSGERSVIRSEREYMEEFSCIFQLHYYPFDKQVCSIVVQVPMKKSDVVSLITKETGSVTFLGNELSTEYEILHQETTTNTNKNHSQVVLFILFSRRVEFHLATTFFQTGLLCCVGILTFWFKIDNFTDRIMVTLTTMLVVATISSSIQSDLPKTYYFKLIDIWLLFCLCLLCFTIAGHTYIAHVLNKLPRISVAVTPDKDGLPTPDRKRKAEVLNRSVVMLVLIVTGLFNVTFWVIGILQYVRSPNEFIKEAIEALNT